ncbi:MAG TPA: cyanophycin synthetase, partial [Rhodothermales bacterium]
AVVTNIEAEHLDTYRDLDDIKASFTQYANAVPFFGAAILCLDDPQVQEIVSNVDRRVVTYGISRQADIRAENVEQLGLQTRFRVVAGSDELGVVTLQLPGLHNVRNSLAAIAVGLELEITFDQIQSALSRFTGVQRRFQKVGEVGDVMILDDYAHHPTEIAATLEAAVSGFPKRRIVAVFQPHLYSRTRDFRNEFARVFFNADVLVLTDVYGSREQPIPGVDGQMLADLAIRYGHRDVNYVQDKEQLPERVAELVRPGDLVITMGAGDVYKAGIRLLERLRAQQ